MNSLKKLLQSHVAYLIVYTIFSQNITKDNYQEC